jgi:hypothetical protein
MEPSFIILKTPTIAGVDGHNDTWHFAHLGIMRFCRREDSWWSLDMARNGKCREMPDIF